MIPPIFFQLKYERTHKDLGSPVVVDGFLLATDGRMCVRAPESAFEPAELAPFAADGRRLPKLADLALWWQANRGEPVPLPAGGKPISACPSCRAAWRDAYPLSPVGGYCCDACGYGHCPDCDGDGWVEDMSELVCGKERILGHYAALLEAAGVTELQPTAGDETGQPLYFRTGQFEGLLMPLVRKEDPP